MDENVKEMSDRVVRELNLKGYEIQFFSETKSLHFKKNFKELAVPLTLIENNRWVDIRHLFRAAFLSGPQVINFGSPNDWSRPKTSGED